MRLSEFQGKYSLHDSPINGLHYFQGAMQLVQSTALNESSSTYDGPHGGTHSNG
jgi:hypothetical protein